MRLRCVKRVFSGFLIVGGYDGSSYLSSSEEYNPETRHACPVDDLKQTSHAGSLCNNLYCGGGNNQRSCVRYNGDGSVTSLNLTLVKSRYHHLCWGLPTGEVLLLGGYDSVARKTTERISLNATSSSPDFNLPYNT